MGGSSGVKNWTGEERMLKEDESNKAVGQVGKAPVSHGNSLGFPLLYSIM